MTEYVQSFDSMATKTMTVNVSVRTAIATPPWRRQPISTSSKTTVPCEPLPGMKKERDATKWLHKTKLCVYAVQGRCTLGSKCSFAHAAVEVQDAPNLFKTQLCDAFAKGECRNENCPFAHGEEELRISPNFKNKLCLWFDKGTCRNGDECCFAHGDDEMRGVPRKSTLDVPVSPSMKPPWRRNRGVDVTTPPPGLTAPPPGLSCVVEEAQKKPTRVLDLAGSILDTKVPGTRKDLVHQLEGMSATIAALQSKMLLLQQASSTTQLLGELIPTELEAASCAPNAAAFATNSSSKKMALGTPLRTPLRSKAQPFQPSASRTQVMSFVPGCGSYKPNVPSIDNWKSDESTSDNCLTGGSDDNESGSASD